MAPIRCQSVAKMAPKNGNKANRNMIQTNEKLFSKNCKITDFELKYDKKQIKKFRYESTGTSLFWGG